MISKRFCKHVFERYIKDCGLDTSCWDCDKAGEMIFRYLAAHDFDVSLWFADWPMSVRTQIVCSTVLCSFDML